MIYYKNWGMAVTTASLPSGFLGMIKKSFCEDFSVLKYITFCTDSFKDLENRVSLNESFEIINSAKRFNLNFMEFKKAIETFVKNPNNRTLVESSRNSTRSANGGLRSSNVVMLAYPKVGMTFFRKDPRRGSSCKVVSIEEPLALVQWAHSGKKTKIKIFNLRNQNLYYVRSTDSSKN